MKENTVLYKETIEEPVKYKQSTYIADSALLYKGQVFKNFKELVAVLGWKYQKSKSNASIAQHKALSAVCRWSFDIDDETGKKLSNRVLIHEVYSEPRGIVDLRKTKSHNYIEYPNFNVAYEQSKDIGVYRVVLNNVIYIGSTRAGFRKRFLSHHSNRGQMPFLDQLYDDGGVFEIVEVMNGASNEEIYKRENEYIEQYLDDANWECLNRRPSYSSNKFKPSPYTAIRVNKEQYDEVFALLIEHGYDVKPFKAQTEEEEKENE